MQGLTTEGALGDFVVTHPLDPEDRVVTNTSRAIALPMKGVSAGIEAREPFDAMMERILPRDDVTFEPDTVGGVPGLWVHPAHARSDEAILHLHAGWFNLGSAKAFRHLVGHIAARVGASAFIPDYRLAPEHPFPAAVDDVLACYRGLDERGIRRIAVTGDSAGGNLALILAACVGADSADSVSDDAVLVGVAALSPVTDLTLSGETYLTRADADPYFTLPQVAQLVRSYLGSADPTFPLASALHAPVSGLPPVRIHVGDDEVLLDDSRSYVERAVAAGTDARLDVWLGMPHGFAGSIGRLKASAQALDAIGMFLTEQLLAAAGPHSAR
ncbi:alpha/beta hydrolase [Paraburkholderia susongensis]|uniref:Acetyl esterase/lipase n=1 Tax=Paraburkholderia susongensis TaxID=1515439 RepID=A0A1X7J8D8_9BURK|nr:alpha/beta hydrolase [Paraburkholderia susongensis]SMG23750.1 Acetyl esterase/lipase [Paraburkholderia susongensis]